MVWLREAFGELSNISQQIPTNPFDCENGCDLTILYAIIIGTVVTTILISIQVQLAREQFSLRNIVTQTKLKNEVQSLLTQMKMLQPVVYQKRKITPQNVKQIEYISKTLNDLEMDLKKLDGVIKEEERDKILQLIHRIRRRLKSGSIDLGKYPHRFESLDFTESIQDLGHSMPYFP